MIVENLKNVRFEPRIIFASVKAAPTAQFVFHSHGPASTFRTLNFRHDPAMRLKRILEH
jgi:hypothetical protein